MSVPEGQGGELVPFPGVEVAPAAAEPAELDGPILEGEWIPAEPEPSGEIARPEHTVPAAGARAWGHRKRREITFYGRRSPQLAARTVSYAPRGLARALRNVAAWAGDVEGRAVVRRTVADGEVKVGDWLKLTDLHRERLWKRGALVGTSSLAALLAAHGLIADPSILTAAAGVGALGGLGWYGRPKGKPFLPPIDAGAGRPISRSTVIEALTEAGIFAGTATAKTECKILTDPIQDGKGYSLQVDLPIGKKTVSDVLRAREAIAGNLGVGTDQLFIDRVPGHAGRFAVWIANADPYATKPPVTPLVKADQVNFFEDCPFGVDARGNLIAFNLVRTPHMLVGAKTNMGKTFAARIPGAWAALDPHVRMYVFDGKGGADWQPFRAVAHCYVASADGESCAAVLKALTEVEQERVRRGEQIKKLAATAPALVPDNKHSEKLARLRKGGMPLIFVVLDEVQEFFDDPTYGKDIAEAAIRLAKLGRAVGIILLIATQRPDKSVVPPGLSGQLSVRLALKTADQASSSITTGNTDSAYYTNEFDETHKGVGWLLGTGEPRKVRAHWLTTEALEAICERGRALRIKAGTLSGHAAGLEDRRTPEILEDALDVFHEGEERLWTAVLLSRLTAAHPARYGPEMTPRKLGQALKLAGLEQSSSPFHGTGPDGVTDVQRGYLRAHLMAALAAYGASPRVGPGA